MFIIVDTLMQDTVTAATVHTRCWKMQRYVYDPKSL